MKDEGLTNHEITICLRGGAVLGPAAIALAEGGFVQKQKLGRSNYYINVALNNILLGNP